MVKNRFCSINSILFILGSILFPGTAFSDQGSYSGLPLYLFNELKSVRQCDRKSDSEIQSLPEVAGLLKQCSQESGDFKKKMLALGYTIISEGACDKIARWNQSESTGDCQIYVYNRIVFAK